MKILILNGPNLNLLGTREPEIYGSKTFEEYFSQLQFQFQKMELGYFQSNSEGDLIDKLHSSKEEGFDAVVFNAGAYTHTSIAIGDAVAGISTPVIEVHISNVMNREEFRHVSYISKHAVGVISGFGLKSYELALNSLH
ncbi:3-dehydroquinate dehydratase [Nonlabens dokdonensis]|jgi:3-dehydroquinate dehydratase-2|uniref:3-dehydroquinate dehydratase n=2 Tax=Nonlabens dokdonensis TaxID=328515 RepID=L7WEH7_NONDD|nr:type II 3-dehydroquinate dehydratase [Nonlabens dokdonensis]AGC77278.1 3-dehydroquinate dehydratase II [Nonlabens dokdonensis DSW-6]PZX40813.1 3-dehydroquinate dehydratase [Nonlabens dokdonensis]